jgi:SHAQKYF class myb-like DNA-binding protein
MSNKPGRKSSYDSDDPSVEEEEDEEGEYEGQKNTSLRPFGKGQIQFLDLTNGEGGDQQNKNHYYDETEEEVEEDDEEEDDEIDALNNTSSPNSNSVTRRVTNKNMPSGGSTTTNPPRVVESGREHTGRWTRDEHQKFLAALNLYGKEWKKVAAHVRTRTVVQTRTHAQKYFQKMFKTGEKGFDASQEKRMSGVKGLTPTSATKISLKKRNKHQLVTSSNISGSIMEQAATSAAARLLTHLPTVSLPAKIQSTPVSSTIPSPSFSASTNMTVTSKLSLPPATSHGFSKPSSLSELLPPLNIVPSTTSSIIPQSTTSNTSLLHERNSDVGSVASSKSPSWNLSKPISIVAPDHDIALRRGFPEPSPAATGKRKLDELAVAQMFAILASSSSAPPSSSSHVCDEDDRATPPPLPPPPFLISSPPFCLSKPPGRLQIVNPDTLGVVATSRHRENEPTTPWDGQLEQLIT